MYNIQLFMCIYIIYEYNLHKQLNKFSCLLFIFVGPFIFFVTEFVWWDPKDEPRPETEQTIWQRINASVYIYYIDVVKYLITIIIIQYYNVRNELCNTEGFRFVIRRLTSFTNAILSLHLLCCTCLILFNIVYISNDIIYVIIYNDKLLSRRLPFSFDMHSLLNTNVK